MRSLVFRIRVRYKVAVIREEEGVLDSAEKSFGDAGASNCGSDLLIASKSAGPGLFLSFAFSHFVIVNKTYLALSLSGGRRVKFDQP